MRKKFERPGNLIGSQSYRGVAQVRHRMQNMRYGQKQTQKVEERLRPLSSWHIYSTVLERPLNKCSEQESKAQGRRVDGPVGWGRGRRRNLKNVVSEMREEARCILCILSIAIGSTLGDTRKLTYLDQVLDHMEKYSCDNVTLKCGMISGRRF